MKTLSSSYLMFRPCKYRRSTLLSRLSFLAHQNNFNVNLSFSFPNYVSHSISAVPPHSQTTDEGEIHHIIQTDQQKTVQVRFLLQKECAFGQQFLIVGDDPVIGLWEPFDGVPLIWSEGHLWTAEVDLPIGKVIKYKFVLQEESGTISWQLGPDRFLETWDTEKTIAVLEDWDYPELQKIFDFSKEILDSSDLVVVDENSSSLITDELTNVNEKLYSDTNGSNSTGEKEPTLLVAENIVERELDLSNAENDEIIGKDNNLVGSEDETRLMTYEGVPVLVPGLISIAREEIEEVLEREHGESTTSNVPNVFVSEEERKHDKGTTSDVPSVLTSKVVSEHEKSTTSDVPSVLVSEVENELDKSTTSDAPSVLVSEVEIKHDKITTSDAPSVLVNEVENELDKSTTSDAPSVLVIKEEIEHDKITTSDAPIVLVSEVENEHEKSTTSDVPILFVSEVEREHDKGTTSNVPNDVEELDVTELKQENESTLLHSSETNQDKVDKVQEEKRALDSVLEGDKQWGRQTLQKFLASLGL